MCMISPEKFQRYKVDIYNVTTNQELTIYLSIDGSNYNTDIEDAIKFVMGEYDYNVISIEKEECIVHIHIDETSMGPN